MKPNLISTSLPSVFSTGKSPNPATIMTEFSFRLAISFLIGAMAIREGMQRVGILTTSRRMNESWTTRFLSVMPRYDYFPCIFGLRFLYLAVTAFRHVGQGVCLWKAMKEEMGNRDLRHMLPQLCRCRCRCRCSAFPIFSAFCAQPGMHRDTDGDGS